MNINTKKNLREVESIFRKKIFSKKKVLTPKKSLYQVGNIIRFKGEQSELITLCLTDCPRVHTIKSKKGEVKFSTYEIVGDNSLKLLESSRLNKYDTPILYSDCASTLKRRESDI